MRVEARCNTAFVVFQLEELVVGDKQRAEALKLARVDFVEVDLLNDVCLQFDNFFQILFRFLLLGYVPRLVGGKRLCDKKNPMSDMVQV